jgi:carbon-monoxide dehydrogenase medium subunit
MIPAAFDYVRAASLRDALAVLAAGEGARVLAGGHSLLPMMKLRLARPSRLLDVAGIAELNGVSEHRRGARIGATTTYRDLLASDLLRERFPIIGECAASIGDLQVRNRGTIGGAIAQADPDFDMPAVMLVLEATFNLRSRRGRRAVSAREFFTGPGTTALADDELLVDIILPAKPKGAGTCYFSIDQPASGYALAGAAAIVARTRKTVSHAMVALTGVADVSRLVPVTDRLVGSRGERDVVARVAAASVEGIEVKADIHGSEPFRRHLTAVVVRRAIEKALERAR